MKTALELCRTEFPDFDDVPECIERAHASGLIKCIAWHNDACPSFARKSGPDTLALFVDYLDPKLSEVREEAGARFFVQDLSGDAKESAVHFGDDAQAALDALLQWQEGGPAMSPTVHLEGGKDYACTLLPGEWNGAVLPRFTRAVAEQIVADAVSEGWAISAKFSDGVCSFVMTGSEELEEFGPGNDGNYHIGSGSWCWQLGQGQTDFAVTAELVAQVAKEFARLIREYLTPDQLASVIEAHRRYGYGAGFCATHDHIDANVVMAEAFQRCGICPPAVIEDAPQELQGRQNAVWEAAWDMAKKADFAL